MSIQLILGDCLTEMRKLKDQSIDLVLTDPPYGLQFEYISYIDTRENLYQLIEKFMPQAIRIAKRAVYVLCGPTQIGLYPQADWCGAITWNTTGSFGKYGYNQWTPILCYGKDLTGFGNVNGVTKSDTIKISGGGGVGFMRNTEEKKHTCPKPITMMRQVINRYCGVNETVLDPFMGSGTTGVACKELGRNFIGIEISSDYYEIAKKRIENTQEMML